MFNWHKLLKLRSASADEAGEIRLGAITLSYFTLINDKSQIFNLLQIPHISTKSAYEKENNILESLNVG